MNNIEKQIKSKISIQMICVAVTAILIIVTTAQILAYNSNKNKNPVDNQKTHIPKISKKTKTIKECIEYDYVESIH
jgi:hypothetical protein